MNQVSTHDLTPYKMFGLSLLQLMLLLAVVGVVMTIIVNIVF